MADTLSPQIAALLLAQQRKTVDPAEQSRRFGQMLMQQGSSVEPVSSPLEGLARTLTGALGGYFEGAARRERETKDQETIGGLTDYAGAMGDPEKQRMALARLLKGDTATVAPFLMQQIADQRRDQLALRDFNAQGGPGGVTTVPGAGGGAPAQPGTPLTIDMTPLPSGQIPQGGGFANNVGNIRATPGVSFPGQGAPQNGFMTFGTPQEGVNAARSNLGAYVQQNPQITVAQAIAKWAPPNENNTQQYISQVAEGTGINPGMPLAEVLKDPAVAAQLLDAITRKEKGGLPQGVTADTFMAATGGGPQVAQGSAQGPSTAAPAPVAPPAAVSRETSAMPEISPAAADLERQAQAALRGGDVERAKALRAKANETQATYVGERAKIENERQYKQSVEQPQQNIQTEQKMREQFDNLQSVKDYRKAANVFRSAVDASKVNSAAADLNMVYAFATLMDPGSVVRDSETGMVTATQSASDRVKAMVAQVSGGQRISPEARQALLREMGSRYEAYKIAHDDLAKTFGEIAQRSGADPRNVVVPYPAVPYTKNDVAAPPPGLPKVGDVLDGYRFKGGDPAKRESWEPAQ